MIQRWFLLQVRYGFSNFLVKFNFFKFLENYYQDPSLWTFMSQSNYLKLKLGLLDSLSTQWSGFEVFVISNISKILLKFANVFKIFD